MVELRPQLEDASSGIVHGLVATHESSRQAPPAPARPVGQQDLELALMKPEDDAIHRQVGNEGRGVLAEELDTGAALSHGAVGRVERGGRPTY
jgi:hypothetical protein